MAGQDNERVSAIEQEPGTTSAIERNTTDMIWKLKGDLDLKLMTKGELEIEAANEGAGLAGCGAATPNDPQAGWKTPSCTAYMNSGGSQLYDQGSSDFWNGALGLLSDIIYHGYRF